MCKAVLAAHVADLLTAQLLAQQALEAELRQLGPSLIEPEPEPEPDPEATALEAEPGLAPSQPIDQQPALSKLVQGPAGVHKGHAFSNMWWGSECKEKKGLCVSLTLPHRMDGSQISHSL